MRREQPRGDRRGLVLKLLTKWRRIHVSPPEYKVAYAEGDDFDRRARRRPTRLRSIALQESGIRSAFGGNTIISRAASLRPLPRGCDHRSQFRSRRPRSPGRKVSPDTSCRSHSGSPRVGLGFAGCCAFGDRFKRGPGVRSAGLGETVTTLAPEKAIFKGGPGDHAQAGIRSLAPPKAKSTI